MAKPAGSIFIYIILLMVIANPAFPLERNIDISGVWEARPAWIGNPTQSYTVSIDNGDQCFNVSDRLKAMKWVHGISPGINSNDTPFLILRYKALNLDTEYDDLIIGLHCSRTPDYMVPVKHWQLISDGNWHSIAVDLKWYGNLNNFDEILLEVSSNNIGNTKFWIEYLKFTSILPAGVESIFPAIDKSTIKNTVSTFSSESLVPEHTDNNAGTLETGWNLWNKLVTRRIGKTIPPVGWFDWWPLNSPPETSLNNLSTSGVQVLFTDVSVENPAEAVAKIGEVLKYNPNACVIFRTGLWPNAKWVQWNNSESYTFTDGDKFNQCSFSSVTWRNVYGKLLDKFVKYIKSSSYAERVLGYQICYGESAEWMTWGLVSWKAGDICSPNLSAFRQWLEARYAGNLQKLQSAWGDTKVTFSNAAIPSLAQRRSTNLYFLRDPCKIMPSIDYLRFQSENTVNTINYFANIVRLADPTAICGVFYGYVSTGFNNGYNNAAWEGHAALAELIKNRNIDYICAPIAYPYRQASDRQQVPLDSVTSAGGKIFFNEVDSRIDEDQQYSGLYLGSGDTLIARLRRNFCYSLTHNSGMWWMLVANGERYARTEIKDMLIQTQGIARKAELDPPKPSAETVVLISENSYLVTPLGIGASPDDLLTELDKAGSPYEIRLISELPSLPRYKLYILPNAFYLTPGERKDLQSIPSNATIVWMLAPGIVGEKGISLYNSKSLFGLTLQYDSEPFTGIKITNSTDTITREVGLKTLTNTVPYIRIPTFSIAGMTGYRTLASHLSNGKPAIIVRDTHPCHIYIATHVIPAEMWHGIMKHAGVHLYAVAGVVVYGGGNWLSVYNEKQGSYTINLPKVMNVEEVFDGIKYSTRTISYSVGSNPVTKLFHITKPARFDNK